MNWDDIIEEAAATDTGMRRSNNQDSHAIVRATKPEAWKARGHIFMVADGMGAHAVGELASKLACDNIPHNYNKMKAVTPAEAITKAYKEVGALIHTRASANRDFQGMGTTCSTLLLLPEGALIAHVGDSRVYRIRGETIDQLSFDHSLAWELVRRNHLSPEEAMKAVPRNVITRSLGPDPNVEVDIEGPLPVEPGDVFLLCSDGLSGHVDDPELGIFAANFHPKDAAPVPHRPGQPPRRPGQHHGRPRQDRPVGRARERAGHPPAPADVDRNGRAGGGFLKRLFGRKKAEPEPVEEHIYRTCPCVLDAEAVDALIGAGPQGPGDGDRADLAGRLDDAHRLPPPGRRGPRRRQDPARPLRALGEAIVLLGTAGRVHKKAASVH